MKVERGADQTTIVVNDRELRLLRFVLERASFIDTPVEDQSEIAAFAARALEQLGELG